MHFGGGEICKGYIKDIFLKERISFYRRTQLILKMYWDYAIDRYVKKKKLTEAQKRKREEIIKKINELNENNKKRSNEK